MFPVLFSLSLSLALILSLSPSLFLSQQSRTLTHIPTGGRVPKVFHTRKVHGHPHTRTHPGCPLQSTIHRVRAGGGLTRGRHTWRQEENEGGKGRAVAKDRFVSVEFSLLFCSLVSLFPQSIKINTSKE